MENIKNLLLEFRDDCRRTPVVAMFGVLPLLSVFTFALIMTCIAATNDIFLEKDEFPVDVFSFVNLNIAYIAGLVSNVVMGWVMYTGEGVTYEKYGSLFKSHLLYTIIGYGYFNILPIILFFMICIIFFVVDVWESISSFFREEIPGDSFFRALFEKINPPENK